jgi:protein-tyrosine phosphatase
VIDTHCHVLPGIDDGPSTLVEAIELAQVFVSQGVEVAVCTPHWSRAFPTSHARATAAKDVLSEALHQASVPLGLVVSAELSDVVAATNPITEIRERSIVGRAVLVEMVRDSLPIHAAVVTRRLGSAGLITVLAHPERCTAIQREPHLLDPLRADGAQVQLVAPSLASRRATREGYTAWDLLETGRVDLVASDAHGTGRRPCELRAAEDLVTERFGSDVWQELTREAPRRLLGALTPAPHPV